jgi:hypothetical protein
MRGQCEPGLGHPLGPGGGRTLVKDTQNVEQLSRIRFGGYYAAVSVLRWVQSNLDGQSVKSRFCMLGTGIFPVLAPKHGAPVFVIIKPPLTAQLTGTVQTDSNRRVRPQPAEKCIFLA